jgi:hypothetical protein
MEKRSESKVNSYKYPVHYKVQYTNDREYRKCIRELFQMNPNNYPDVIEEADEDFKDEVEYDDESAEKVIDYIMSITKNDPLYHELYEMAAATMMTEDLGLGLVLLFSYDYLELFHPILILYINPDLYKFKDIREDAIEKLTLLKRKLSQKNNEQREPEVDDF